MECKWIDNIFTIYVLFDSSTCSLFFSFVFFLSNIKAVLSNVAFTVAVYTFKSSSQLCMFLRIYLNAHMLLSSLLFPSEAMGSVVYYVKRICNRIQVNSLIAWCLSVSQNQSGPEVTTIEVMEDSPPLYFS